MLKIHDFSESWVNWQKMTIFSIWKRFQFQKRTNNRNHYSRPQAHKVRLFVTTGSKFTQGWETGSYHLKFRVKRNVSSISTGHLSEVFEKGKPPKSVSLPRKVIFTEEDMKQLSPQTSLGHSTGPELPIFSDITGITGRKSSFCTGWLVTLKRSCAIKIRSD